MSDRVNAIAAGVVLTLLAAVAIYSSTAPDPIREQLGREAAEAAAEQALDDLHECLSQELSRYPDDPTDEQYALAEELCR